MTPTAFCASVGGTTVQAIMCAIQSGRIRGIAPVLLLTDRPDIGVTAKARALGMPERDIVMLRRREYATSEAYGEAIIALFREREVEWFGLYGWLTKMPANVVGGAYRGFNQHPAPHWFGGKGMYGKRPHAAVLEFKRLLAEREGWVIDYTLVISQFVHEEFNRGEVVRYSEVPIQADDTPATLQERALPIEWDVQIETFRLLGGGYELDPSQSYYDNPFVRPGEDGLAARANRFALTIQP